MATFKRHVRAGVRATDKQMADQASSDKRRRDRAFSQLLSKFRWAVDAAGILSQAARSIAYEKPSDKRRAVKRQRELELRRGGPED